MDSFQETRFKNQVNDAMYAVKRVLKTTRSPCLPADVPHQYDDKYSLAEFLTNITLSSIINCLEFIGVDAKVLSKLLEWGKDQSVTLRFKSEEKCVFDREEKRKQENPTSHVTQVGIAKITEKVVVTVTEYFWKYDLNYEIYAFNGSSPDNKITIQKKHLNYEIMTTSNVQPRPKVAVHPNLEINIGWLLSNIKQDNTMNFVIKRASKSCHTPRRNPDVDSALQFFTKFGTWTTSVEKFFSHNIFLIQRRHPNIDKPLSKMNFHGLFVPVLPLFEKRKQPDEETPSAQNSLVVVKSASSTASDVVLPLRDLNDFLYEEKRSINEKFAEIDMTFPDKQLITTFDVHLVIIMMHLKRVCQHYFDGVNYIEHMLYTQLVQAIGKEVSSADFTNYMKYHNRQLFKPEYEPKPFCYSIRRPEHYPEGTLSIEATISANIPEPIPTIVRTTDSKIPMFFPINASTKVGFVGDRNLHAWVGHQFSTESGLDLSLNARARQFSSFILVVGRIAGADLFDPKYAIIIQNKDELKIPLLLEQIPTPKEFKDAIESLSPEQQRFAKAYRGLQLSSTLFGVLVIQIKPQLEKLLKLPYDSLTKEIRLTQDLMELFIKYQIPSDLLSYEGPSNLSPNDKVSKVKVLVTEMYSMIKTAQQREIEEEKKKLQYIAPIFNQYDSKKERKYEKREKADFSMMEKKKHKSMDKSKDKAMSPRRSSVKSSSMLAKPLINSPSPSLPSPAIVSNSSATILPAPTTLTSTTPAATAPEPENFSLEIQPTSETQDEDYTQIPSELDSKFEELDEDSALRPTIINPGITWTKNYQKSLLTQPASQTLSATEQGTERNKAFDLLDALTKSGALLLDYTSLHVILTATHCFDKNLMNTVIQDNINPIEKLERSVLIVAETIHGRKTEEMIKADHLERVKTYSAVLFKGDSLTLEEKKKEKVVKKKETVREKSKRDKEKK